MLAAAVLVAAAALQPGAVTSLNGTWEYQPASTGKSYSVPVPQMLNRIQWWLDDSEDFKGWENARLARLGFDTDKDEDGTYRLELNVPALPPGRHLFVEFDGVAMLSKVWINGHLLGDHTGMFSRFGYDLTPHLKAGVNELKVWVSMEKLTVSSRPMSEAVTVNLTASKVLTLDKGMFGPLSPGRPNREYDMHGIWQPVRLVARDSAMLDDAWFIPSLTGAEVRIEAHPLEPGTKMQVRARWFDAAGYLFAEAAPVPIDRTGTLRLAGVRPRLWTPADPRLYRLEVQLETLDDRVLDRIERKVGFRTFEVRGNQLYLNGHRYWLRGANQLPYGKNPWDPRLARALIKLMHDNNLRVTRTHATPWNEAWLDAADEIGLGVSIEGVRPWALAGLIGMPPKAIADHWLAENGDVVRRIRSHPSVLIWTVGNEMLLRDAKNLDKWKLLSDVVKQTRALDPYRPVVASSEYTRDPEVYDKELEPAGIDDGDLDDIHRYRGWYTESPFATDSKFETEMRRNQGKRPFIGQEMSSGYPDLDAGSPVKKYADELLTPQAWVGSDKAPPTFLEHHRAVTKRWAEQLRFQRGDQTAGFLMFSAECWFHHSYEPDTIRPYPVVASMKEAWAPIGLALETGRRRFFSDEKLDTAVYITNDDEQFRDFKNLELRVNDLRVPVPDLPYFATVRAPISLPAAANIRLSLYDGNTILSTSTEPVALEPPAPVPNTSAFVRDLKSDWRKRAEAGQTVVLLNPGKALVDLFPNDVESFRAVVGEFAEALPASGFAGPLKWWGRKDDWRVFVTSGAHRLKQGGKARELVRFIPAHSYIPPERVPEQYMTVVFDIPVGKGIVRVVDLELDESVPVVPQARRVAAALLK